MLALLTYLFLMQAENILGDTARVSCRQQCQFSITNNRNIYAIICTY